MRSCAKAMDHQASRRHGIMPCASTNIALKFAPSHALSTSACWELTLDTGTEVHETTSLLLTTLIFWIVSEAAAAPLIFLAEGEHRCAPCPTDKPATCNARLRCAWLPRLAGPRQHSPRLRKCRSPAALQFRICRS